MANAKSISEEQYAQIENALLSGSAYYVPEGFRYAKHILVGFDEEKQNELLTLRANTDDNDAAANADDKRAQYLAEIQSEADEVLAQVQAGGDFAALMAQYSDDTQALSYPNGYAVSPGATMFDTAFQQGVFSLENPGDVSALIPSDYGYHIILYSADVPAGVTPYEQVAEILRNEVLSTKQSTAYQAILDQWQTELHLTVDRAAFGLSEDDGSAADKTSAGDTAAANGENSDTNGEG